MRVPVTVTLYFGLSLRFQSVRARRRFAQSNDRPAIIHTNVTFRLIGRQSSDLDGMLQVIHQELTRGRNSKVSSAASVPPWTAPRTHAAMSPPHPSPSHTAGPGSPLRSMRATSRWRQRVPLVGHQRHRSTSPVFDGDQPVRVTAWSIARSVSSTWIAGSPESSGTPARRDARARSSDRRGPVRRARR